jgi:hypothetical protein
MIEKEAPFKSKAQMKKFFAMEKRHELPKGKAKEWVKHTPKIKDLPEHVAGSAKHSKAAQLATNTVLDKIAKAALSAKQNRQNAEEKQAQIGLPKTMLRGGALNLADPRNIAELGITALLGGALGTGVGYGAARLSGPSVKSISNLRQEEEALEYAKGIEEIKARIEARKARLMGI